MTLNSVSVASRSASGGRGGEVAPIASRPIGSSFQMSGANASARSPDSIDGPVEVVPRHAIGPRLQPQPELGVLHELRGLVLGDRLADGHRTAREPPCASGTTPIGVKAKTVTVSMPSMCSASAQIRSAVSSIVGAASRRASETVVAARSLISVVSRSEATRSRPTLTRWRATASRTTRRFRPRSDRPPAAATAA
jgi:hypothetical protein